MTARRRDIGVVVMACVALALALFSAKQLPRLRDRDAPPGSLAALVGAAGADVRPIESRLTGGFRWAPFRGPKRDVTATDSLAIAARIVLTTPPTESSSETARARGAAYLLSGHHESALETLAAIAARGDADALSDLAAAQLESSIRHRSPRLLAEALASADRALRARADHVEALFNRALALERLGLRDDARLAWERYLAVDATSDWSHEARGRHRRLTPEPAFLEQLDAEHERAQRYSTIVTALARQDPFGARATGIRDILGRWADAVAQGNVTGEQRQLEIARRLGEAVAGDGGDEMLLRAVEAIDRASPAVRSELARGHASYRTGLELLATSRIVDAEAAFVAAAEVFERHGNPVALPARTFAAMTRFEQGRREESEREFRRLLNAIEPEYSAYRAFIVWQLGLCHAARADWGGAVRLLDATVSDFERLGETQNAAAVHRLLAFVHDQIGNRDSAANHWIAALSGSGRRSDLMLAKAVQSIAHAAALRRDWHVAASFFRLQAEIARRLDESVVLGDALFASAAVRDQMGDGAGAAADLAAAADVAAGIDDPAYRAHFALLELQTRGTLASTPSSEAVVLLTRAIDLHSSRAERIELPALFLHRARAHRAAGDAARAERDLERGIVELERHRGSLPEGELRWGAFHAAEELFEEAITLAVERNDAPKALQYAERARARSLLDVYGQSAVADFAALPDDCVVLSYVALPSRLIIFTVRREGVQAVTADVSREELTRAARDLSHALSSDAQENVTRELYRALVAPVEWVRTDAKTIVVVPDSTTAPIPFAALRDTRGEYLLQRHTIVVSPSAATFLSATARREREARPPQFALVISSSAAAGEDTLSFARGEARRVAELYARAVHVDDREADGDVFAKAGDAEVLHFAGHAIGDSRGLEPASIVVGVGAGQKRLTVRDIAALRLQRNATVVLAGCSTARGEPRASEGVLSVAHGFLMAGASSVIATLWKIDDGAASVFFPRLHERLAAGVPPAEALRETQLESIRRGDVPISLWAAVQNIGS